MRAKIVALALSIAVVCVGAPMLGGDEQTAAAPAVAGRVHARYHPNDGKIFVLIIGSDARSGNPYTARADAIHIAGINTKTMRGGILNFPRDSWVNIPGHGTSKINEALYRGGPELLARTLESLTGIRIDYWMMTGFHGFEAAINAVQGVKYKVRQNVFDPGGSGAKIPAGTKWLHGASALAYARTRHSFSGGDVARTTNQGRLLLALLRKFRRAVDADPINVLEWMGVARKYTRFDLRPDEMFKLGVLASQVKSGDVGNVTVPVSIGSVGAASVVFINPGAQSLYARFKKHASL